MANVKGFIIHGADRPDANVPASEVVVGDILKVMNVAMEVTGIEEASIGLRLSLNNSALGSPIGFVCRTDARLCRIQEMPLAAELDAERRVLRDTITYNLSPYETLAADSAFLRADTPLGTPYYDPTITVQTQFHISAEMLCDLITTAIEAPSGQWLGAFNTTGGQGYTHVPGSGVVYGQKQFYEHRGWRINFEHDSPTGEEGDRDGNTTLTAEVCAKALGLMALHHPGAWADLMQDNMDSDTADCFMQFACFGEIIFD